jgi:shikimate dehydrogenase
MHAHQIHPIKFKNSIKNLFKDKNYLASAITMPFKKKALPFVKISDKITKYSQSINFIYKKKNKIYGYNTDVYGALDCIKKKKNKSILIYGFGGTGEAILRTFCKIYKKSNFIVVSKKNKPRDIKDKNIKFIKRKNLLNLDNIDIAINCSPLGSNLSKKYINRSPFKQNQLFKRKKNLLVFDLVYKPNSTLLSKLCKKNKIDYLNGLKMNTIQANKALKIIKKNYFIRS